MTESHTKATMQDASYALHQKNTEQIKTLSTPYQDFYFDCQSYLYLSTPPSLAVDKELEKLVKKLTLAEKQGLTVDAVIGVPGETYCKGILRRIKAPKYDLNSHYYLNSIFFYILFTLTLVSLFEAIRGGIHYGSIATALQMPVQFSLLGIPLQILVLLAAFFFGVQFRIHRSFESTWYSDGNLLYLLAFILTTLSAILIPFMTHYYGVFLISLPVWLIWLIAIIAGLYFRYRSSVDFSDWIFRFMDKRQSSKTNETTAMTTEEITENHLNATEVSDANDTIEPETAENPSIWQTIRIKNPLITRKSYRKMREKEEKWQKREEKAESKKQSKDEE